MRYVPQKGGKGDRVLATTHLQRPLHFGSAKSDRLQQTVAFIIVILQVEKKRRAGVITVAPTSCAYYLHSPQVAQIRTTALGSRYGLSGSFSKPMFSHGYATEMEIGRMRQGGGETRVSPFPLCFMPSPRASCVCLPAIHNVRRSWLLQANNAWSGKLPASAEAVFRILCG